MKNFAELFEYAARSFFIPHSSSNKNYSIMRKLLFCMLGLAMTACAPRKAGNVNNGSDELAMLVGTYTDGNSKGIYTFRFNQETGLALSLIHI